MELHIDIWWGDMSGDPGSKPGKLYILFIFLEVVLLKVSKDEERDSKEIIIKKAESEDNNVDVIPFPSIAPKVEDIIQ